MKTITIIMSLFITAFLTGLLTYHKPASTDISVLGDITDSLISKPDAGEILSLYDLSRDNKWNTARFRFLDISDVSLNRATELKIEAENKWFSNEIERGKEIKGFQNKISEILSQHESIGKTHSSVYLPLALELKRLSESKSEKRILIVYSDLMENTPDISFYNKKDFEMFQSNPDSLEKLFESKQPLPSLSGIEIYIIYRPSDVAKDVEFRAVSEFYRKMLERKGARVNISANLAN